MYTMTVKMSLCVRCMGSRPLACVRQTLMVVLINIPTISFGLAMGWVSLATGESSAEGARSHVVGAAAVTFCASLAGMPLCGRALSAGRKPAVIATSALFVVCWSLKLCGGGWWIVGARVFAGLAGAGAWLLAPIVAREMCGVGVRGAAVSALVLANNLGMLLMYLAALLHLHHRTVLWSCLALSVVHCVVFMFVPESPHYLAAHGHADKARESLAWLRALPLNDPALHDELAEFNAKQASRQKVSPFQLFKDMVSDRGRRIAFIFSCVMILGQEVSGVLALLQYAERVFVVARDGAERGPHEAMPAPRHDELSKPALHAVLLGAAQLVASAVGLYLIEKIGRKPLMVWCGAATGLSLCAGGAVVLAGRGGGGAAAALALAVFADSAGFEPAPYAMAADMFDYEYRSCAMMVMEALTWLGNAVEVALFPALVTTIGLGGTLLLAGAVTLVLVAAAHLALPETRGRSTRDIYDDILKRTTFGKQKTNTNEDIVTKL